MKRSMYSLVSFLLLLSPYLGAVPCSFDVGDGIRQIATKVLVPNVCDSFSKSCLIEATVNEALDGIPNLETKATLLCSKLLVTDSTLEALSESQMDGAASILEDIESIVAGIMETMTVIEQTTSDVNSNVEVLEQCLESVTSKTSVVEQSVFEVIDTSVELLEKTCSILECVSILEEIERNEAHCPVYLYAADFPLTISSPGYYIFAEDVLVSGVLNTPLLQINASRVTVDFNNKVLWQTDATAGVNGVEVASGQDSVVIKNGTIADASATGVFCTDTNVLVKIADMNIIGVGTTASTDAGIFMGSGGGMCAIERCKVTNTTGRGLDLALCTNINVVDCDFNQNANHGARATNSTNCWFVRCRVNNNIDTGIEMSASSACEFIDCTCNSTTSTGSAYGVNFDATSDAHKVIGCCVAGVTTTDMLAVGFNIAGTNHYLKECRAVDGTAVTSAVGFELAGQQIVLDRCAAVGFDHGIEVVDNRNCVSGCLAKNNRIHGITDRSTADSVVEGSEVYGNGGYGIDAPGSGIYVFGNEAANNTLGNYNQSVLSGAITIQDLPALTLAETPFNILFNVDITG